MKGNTAIFYDMENLFRGYNSSKTYINNISLKSIFQEIKQLEIVGRIIVQKAYANWSDPRLSVLKREINELGIDPIQVFGFSYYYQKNAADIQLAVDCIDIAYLRPNIDIFVIVSGDGGFSAVAKKLHEYGKYVIGCSYPSSMNEILESVCDHFISIEEPLETAKDNRKNEVQKPEIQKVESAKDELLKTLKITNQMVIKMSRNIPRIKPDNRDEIIHQSRRIIDWLSEDVDSVTQLNKEGIHLSVMKEAFKYAIEDFDSVKIGLPKFVQFLQYICRDTKLKVITSLENQTKIIFNNINLNDFQTLPALDDNYLHSLDNYKSILSLGNPRIRLIKSEDFYLILSLITSYKNLSYACEDLIKNINHNYPQISLENINQCLSTLASLNILQVDDPEKSVMNQVVTLNPQYVEKESIYQKLRESIEIKLQECLGTIIDNNLVNQLKKELSLEDTERKITINNLIQEANVYLNKNEYKKALNPLTKALNIDKKNVYLLILYIETLIELDEIDRAFKILDYGLKIAPNHPTLLTIYGNTLLKINREEEANKFFAKALPRETKN